MTLRRRAMVSGIIASVLYAGILLLVILAPGSIKPLHQAVPAALLGLGAAFAGGALLFGLVPHLLGKFMESASSTFDFINKAALAVALVSILVGVIASLLLIFGIAQAVKPLLVAVTLFAGSAATMCSLRFFYGNRGNA